MPTDQLQVLFTRAVLNKESGKWPWDDEGKTSPPSKCPVKFSKIIQIPIPSMLHGEEMLKSLLATVILD